MHTFSKYFVFSLIFILFSCNINKLNSLKMQNSDKKKHQNEKLLISEVTKEFEENRKEREESLCELLLKNTKVIKENPEIAAYLIDNNTSKYIKCGCCTNKKLWCNLKKSTAVFYASLFYGPLWAYIGTSLISFIKDENIYKLCNYCESSSNIISKSSNELEYSFYECKNECKNSIFKDWCLENQSSMCKENYNTFVTLLPIMSILLTGLYLFFCSIIFYKAFTEKNIYYHKKRKFNSIKIQIYKFFIKVINCLGCKIKIDIPDEYLENYDSKELNNTIKIGENN